VALPIAFFAFILLIAVSWNRARIQKDKAITQPVTSTIRPNEKSPNIESKTFEDTQTIAGRVASRIRARRVVAYESHWTTLEDVQLTIFRPTGLTYELACPTAQFNSETKEADAKGGVIVTSSDGVEIRTAEIHFDGNRLTNHIPVQFKIDRWAGSAGALDLDVQAERARLYDKFEAAVPASIDETAMTVKSLEGIFSRKENNAAFNTNVVMTHDTSRLAADRVMATVSADRKNVTGVEGQGHVNIITVDDVGGAGRKEITCERFWSEAATGQLSAINASGEQGVVHAVIDGPPKRDVVAKTVRVALANRQVTEMRGQGEVVMKELSDLPREMSAENLTVAFDPLRHQATNAVAQEKFHYKDPKNEARAVRATYDIIGDHVILSAVPGFDPTVVSDGQTLKAKTIDFSPRAGTAKANGEVIAQIISKQGGPGADSTAMFPAGKPVFVNSDVLNMRQANKLAIFSGHVRAWQDTNTLFAEEMQVQGAGDQITARGNVRTSIYNTEGAEPRKTPLLTQSEHFAAHKAERRIDLMGGVKIDDDQRHMTAEKASFFFDAAKKLERIEAENKVVLLEPPAGRKATGEKATYYVSRRVVYMSGSPATATTSNGSVSGDQIAMDLARNKVEIMSPTSATKGTYKPPQ
jgi:LPS export ABC transporter protein LptC